MGAFQLPKISHPDFSLPRVKPRGAVTVDWDNPLTDGLVACWVFDNSVHDVGPNSIGVVLNEGTTADFFPAVRQGEKCWHNQTANNNNVSFSPEALPLGASNRSVVVRFNASSIAAEANLIAWGDEGTAEEFTVNLNSTGSGFITRLTGGAPAAAFSTADDGNWHTMALSAKGVSTGAASDFIYHVDGTKLTTTSVPSLTLATLPTYGYFGERAVSTATYFYTGYLSIALVFDRQISNAAAKELTLDPFQILKPAIPLVYFVPADADSTAPTLSLPTSTSITQTTATVGCTTDEGNGTLYAVATAADSEPSAAQVKAGENSGGTTAIWSGSASISTTGAKTIAAGDTLVPGTTYYLWYMHEDAATNQSTVLDGGSLAMLSHFGESEIHDGNEPPTDSILHYYAGTHTPAGTSTTVLTDSAANGGSGWTVDELIGLTVYNTTDPDESTITDNDGTTATHDVFASGIWNQGDAYKISATIDTSDVMYCETPVTVTSEQVTIDWYAKDVSASTWSPIYTQTITGLTGVADGSYNVTLGVDGTLALTAVSGENGEGSSDQVLGGGSSNTAGWYYKYRNANKIRKKRLRRGRR